MDNIVINGVSSAAGLCSMASFVPQLIKIAREKYAAGVSLRMFAITIVGFVLCTTYGVLQDAWPVAASHAICLVLTSAIFPLRLRYGGD
jgi:MtN3 and saliva related transmembrane protein